MSFVIGFLLLWALCATALGFFQYQEISAKKREIFRLEVNTDKNKAEFKRIDGAHRSLKREQQQERRAFERKIQGLQCELKLRH